MRFKEWDDYIDCLLRQVKFRPDHDDIRAEYEEHLEDLYGELVSCGVPEDEAAKDAVRSMGDPVEAGKLLNSVHNAFLGWLERLLRWAMALLIVLSVIPLLSVALAGGESLIGMAGGYRDTQEHGALVYSVPVGESVALDNHTISFDEVRLYEDGVFELRYRDRLHLFDRAVKWSYDLGFSEVRDGNGNTAKGGSGSGGGSFLSRHQQYFEGFSPDIRKLVIERRGSEYAYKGRDFRIEIDLSGAKEAAGL